MAPVIVSIDKTVTLSGLDEKIVHAKSRLRDLRAAIAANRVSHDRQRILHKSRQEMLTTFLSEELEPNGNVMRCLKLYREVLAEQGSPTHVLRLESRLCQLVHLMEAQERSKLILSDQCTDLIGEVESEIKELESTFSEKEVVLMNQITQRTIETEMTRSKFEELVTTQNYVTRLLNELIDTYAAKRASLMNSQRELSCYDEPTDDDGAFVEDLVSSFATLKTLLDESGSISRRNEEVQFVDEKEASIGSPVSVRTTFFSSLR